MEAVVTVDGRRELEAAEAREGLATADRQVVVDRITSALARLSQRHDAGTFAVLHVRLDQCGHAAGASITPLLGVLGHVRLGRDVVAEVGPGPLALCCEGVLDEHDAAAIARRVCEALTAGGGHTVSIGVVVGTREHLAAEEILAEAAFASTMVRANGGGYELFDPCLQDRVTARLLLDAR